jgi:hypothetical protein
MHIYEGAAFLANCISEHLHRKGKSGGGPLADDWREGWKVIYTPRCLEALFVGRTLAAYFF